jgi:hypothetical protein
MLHGAAGSDWQSLKMLGKFCDMRDMEIGIFGAPKNARTAHEIRIFTMDEGSGFDPRLAE